MNPDELRALADALSGERIAGMLDAEEAQVCEDAAGYLRAQAAAQPYETERWNVEKQTDGSLLVCFNRHEKEEKCEYEHFVPAQAAPQAEPCIGDDPICPCQDGDACHYKDSADGTKAWPVPQSEPKRKPACLWSRADDELRALDDALAAIYTPDPKVTNTLDSAEG